MSRLLEILGRAMTTDVVELLVSRLAEKIDAAARANLTGIIRSIMAMNIEMAAEQLKSYLLQNPGCVDGHLAAAILSLYENDLEVAIEELEWVRKHQPANIVALYALGHCYEQIDREDKAVEVYQDCLKFRCYLKLPRQRLAAIYFKNGQLEKTVREYETLVGEFPDDIASLVVLGNLYIANSLHKNAAEAFNKAILISPDNFQFEDAEVEQMIQDGQLYDAVDRIQTLLDSEPDRAEVFMRLADVLGMLGAASEAIENYERAIKLSPAFLEATIKLGTQYFNTGNDYKAARQYNKATELNDQIVDAYAGLANAYKLGGNVSEALSVLSLASAINANSSMLFAQTAGLYFKTGLCEEDSVLDHRNNFDPLFYNALDAHRKLAELQPDNPSLHYRFGLLLMSISQYPSAISSFKNVLRINPMFDRARYKLAICMFETGCHHEALQQLTPGQYLDQPTLRLHYKTALLYCNKLRFASSLLNFQQALDENYTQTDLAVNISLVLQNLGLTDAADFMWQQLSNMAEQAKDV